MTKEQQKSKLKVRAIIKQRDLINKGHCSNRNTVSVSVAQECPTLCNPVDYSPPGSSVHGTSQARILEWLAISFSGIEPTSSALDERFFTAEPPGKPLQKDKSVKVKEKRNCHR